MPPLSFVQTVRAVAVINLGYFVVEFAVAVHIGSVALLADSVDFLEDASINFLIAVAVAWSAKARARVGMLLAGILLVPGLATFWTAAQKFLSPSVPEPFALTATGAGALAVNVLCAVLLTRFRHHSGSLSRAAFLSARNDAFANIAIIASGLVTVFYPSAWPDLLVGLGIAALNAGAARDVFRAAQREHRVTPQA